MVRPYHWGGGTPALAKLGTGTYIYISYIIYMTIVYYSDDLTSEGLGLHQVAARSAHHEVLPVAQLVLVLLDGGAADAGVRPHLEVIAQG